MHADIERIVEQIPDRETLLKRLGEVSREQIVLRCLLQFLRGAAGSSRDGGEVDDA